jgi:hypothetical protein
MSGDFSWANGQPSSYRLCRSDARSWTELKPALIAAWCGFAEVLGTEVPVELRTEIHLSFFSSSGRVTFGHAKRHYPVEQYRWDLIPTDYVRTVACHCAWIEEQWDAVDEVDLGSLGVAFATAALEAASDPHVIESFQRQQLTTLMVYGQGVTQSPAKFETTLAALMHGQLPIVCP